jgi:hypothetical protein
MKKSPQNRQNRNRHNIKAFGRGIVLLAGAGPNGHPAGTKPGDLIHFFQSGTTEVPKTLGRLIRPATFG